jgi:MFS family permease
LILKNISRTVWLLSLVSLFTDTASEMLYPVMPIYLKSIGFSVVLIGVLEGIAEATAGLSKGYFGKQSDISGKRLPFVQIGYAFSAVSKPLMALFTYPVWIFFARTIDRLGKGIRTGARDALLSDEATPETKGKIFGFHRSMDTLGAVLGPLIALIYLYYHPEDFKTLFFIAFAPGVLAIVFTLIIKEKKKNLNTQNGKNPFFSFLNYWKESPKAYKKLVTGLLIFTLINSSDVFLLLKAKDAGLSDTEVIGVYIFYNLIYALFAFPLGIIADKTSLKTMLLTGLIIFSGVYLGMAFSHSLGMIMLLFFLYGIYAAATEGVSKAWISNIVNKNDVATAIGNFTGFQSIFTMLASSLTGLIWYTYGAATAFIITSIITLLIVIYIIISVPAPENKN